MTDKDDKQRSKVDDYIDQNLKRVYSKLEDEAVPDRFKDLLEKLRKQDEKPTSDE